MKQETVETETKKEPAPLRYTLGKLTTHSERKTLVRGDGKEVDVSVIIPNPVTFDEPVDVPAGINSHNDLVNHFTSEGFPKSFKRGDQVQIKTNHLTSIDEKTGTPRYGKVQITQHEA